MTNETRTKTDQELKDEIYRARRNGSFRAANARIKQAEALLKMNEEADAKRYAEYCERVKRDKEAANELVLSAEEGKEAAEVAAVAPKKRTRRKKAPDNSDI